MRILGFNRGLGRPRWCSLLFVALALIATVSVTIELHASGFEVLRGVWADLKSILAQPLWLLAAIIGALAAIILELRRILGLPHYSPLGFWWQGIFYWSSVAVFLVSSSSVPMLAVFGGYAFATVIAHVPISMLLWKAWRLTPVELQPSSVLHWPWKSFLLGSIERALYVAALQLSQPQLIGAWLVLKVAGRWGYWAKEGGKTYDLFVLGNGLSLAYAAVGWRFIQQAQGCNGCLCALAFPTIIVGATVLGQWLLRGGRML